MTRSPIARTISAKSQDATRALGADLARLLRPGDVVLLHGDLGAGKTTLTQGIAAGFGVAGPVQSPTFTIVAEHLGHAGDGQPLRLHHLDLYRLGGQAELDDIGFDELLAPRDGVSVVEWPERAGDWLPDGYLLVEIVAGAGDERRLTFTAVPADGELAARIAAWSAAAEPIP